MTDSPVVKEAERIVRDEAAPIVLKKILYGKKTVLFGFEPIDLPRFVQLHQQDSRGYMQDFCFKDLDFDQAMHLAAQLFLSGALCCWSVYLKYDSIKELKGEKRVGFVYLTKARPGAVNISGILDMAVMKGLLRHIQRGDVTIAEDAMRTMIDYCFGELKLNRIETTVLADNRRALALEKKCGFKEEGNLREAFMVNGKFFDVIPMSILRKEWENGIIRRKSG